MSLTGHEQQLCLDASVLASSHLPPMAPVT
ncbi:MAG: hypothetical protein ACI9EF_002034 [Pseudohongiellaceae bacterium]|jgi:hypothetical protein